MQPAGLDPKVILHGGISGLTAVKDWWWYLRKSGAFDTMFSKSEKESLLSPSRSASSMDLSQTSVTSSGVSSPLVSLFRVFFRSSLQMKLSLLKSEAEDHTLFESTQLNLKLTEVFTLEQTNYMCHPETCLCDLDHLIQNNFAVC